MSVWNDADRAPYDTVVEVRTFGKKRFHARLLRDHSLTEDERVCDQWVAEEGEKYPRCWSGGECWSSNENGIASDPVMEWRPTPDSDVIGRLVGALEKIATVDMGGGFLGAQACRKVAAQALASLPSAGSEDTRSSTKGAGCQA